MIIFETFAKQVAHKSRQMAKQQMFLADIDGDELYWAYLHAFPQEFNRIYKTRSEHDCNNCRNFIKRMGGAVTIKDGVVDTIWNVSTEEPYRTVCEELHKLVSEAPIKSLFRTSRQVVGVEHNIQMTPEGRAIKWAHLHCDDTGQAYATEPAAVISYYRDRVKVARRGLKELRRHAVDTVLDKAERNEIYRSNTFIDELKKFRIAMNDYDRPESDRSKELYLWENAWKTHLQIRNTAIGTLLIDLSIGMAMQRAVHKYENMVSPENYRRSKAPVGKSQIVRAMEKVKELGLTEALHRRPACLADIPSGALLWVDRPKAPKLEKSMTDLLLEEAVTPSTSISGIQQMPIADFLSKVLPNAGKLEILFDRTVTGNLVSLTTAAVEGQPNLLAWDSPVAWSYRGSYAESIVERVKAARGRTDAFGRISAGWWNLDDLDLHCVDPRGKHIFYGNRRPIGCKGELDVDMNVTQAVRGAVENIYWEAMDDGLYRVGVNNFRRRESIDTGYELDIAIGDFRAQLSYNRPVMEWTSGLARTDFREDLNFTVRQGKVVDIFLDKDLIKGPSGRSEWGLPFNEFARVRVVVPSPNHWGEKKVGQPHWFFLIEECVSPEPIRGIYNEYLCAELQPHRRVFEVLGDKTKAPVEGAMQLSGLGFSNARKTSCVVRVDGRPYRVLFAA